MEAMDPGDSTNNKSSGSSGGLGEWGGGVPSDMSSKVLLLNASFEPLGIVTDRRAVVLLLAGRVEAIAVHADPPVLHSPSRSIEVPAIVRLSHMVKVGRNRSSPPPSRRGVLRRDGGRCAYCNASADTVDHVVPKSRGGATSWTNLVAACRRHNMEKGDRLLAELGWELNFEPVAPRTRFALVRQANEADPLWEPYLQAS